MIHISRIQFVQQNMMTRFWKSACLLSMVKTISWCRNFVKRQFPHSFTVSMWKLCLSTKFPHQEIVFTKYPANIYSSKPTIATLEIGAKYFKVNNKDDIILTLPEIIKNRVFWWSQKGREWRRFGVFIVNFNIFHTFL